MGRKAGDHNSNQRIRFSAGISLLQLAMTSYVIGLSLLCARTISAGSLSRIDALIGFFLSATTLFVLFAFYVLRGKRIPSHYDLNNAGMIFAAVAFILAFVLGAITVFSATRSPWWADE